MSGKHTKKHTRFISVIKHTENGTYLSEPFELFRGEVAIPTHAEYWHIPGLTLQKIPTGVGGRPVGTHKGMEDGEVYTVNQHKF